MIHELPAFLKCWAGPGDIPRGLMPVSPPGGLDLQDDILHHHPIVMFFSG